MPKVRTRKCSKCGVDKPLDSSFHIKRKRKDGSTVRDSRCKSCKKKDSDEKAAAYRARTPKQIAKLDDLYPSKKCCNCKTVKSRSEFYIQSGSRDGIGAECKQCGLDRVTEKQRANSARSDAAIALLLEDPRLKTCASCNTQQPRSEFYLWKASKDGLSPYCKRCKKASGRAKSEAFASRSDSEILVVRSLFTRKRCHKCKLEKDASEFYDNRSKRDGLSTDCIPCSNERSAAYSKSEAGRNCDRNRYAKRKGADGTATTKQIDDVCRLYGSRCYICDAKLIRSGPRKGNKFTIDHLIPIKHGGPNWIWNLRPACWTCNARKSARIDMKQLSEALKSPEAIVWLSSDKGLKARQSYANLFALRFIRLREAA